MNAPYGFDFPDGYRPAGLRGPIIGGGAIDAPADTTIRYSDMITTTLIAASVGIATTTDLTSELETNYRAQLPNPDLNMVVTNPARSADYAAPANLRKVNQTFLTFDADQPFRVEHRTDEVENREAPIDYNPLVSAAAIELLRNAIDENYFDFLKTVSTEALSLIAAVDRTDMRLLSYGDANNGLIYNTLAIEEAAAGTVVKYVRQAIDRALLYFKVKGIFDGAALTGAVPGDSGIFMIVRPEVFQLLFEADLTENKFYGYDALTESVLRSGGVFSTNAFEGQYKKVSIISSANMDAPADGDDGWDSYIYPRAAFATGIRAIRPHVFGPDVNQTYEGTRYVFNTEGSRGKFNPWMAVRVRIASGAALS